MVKGNQAITLAAHKAHNRSTAMIERIKTMTIYFQGYGLPYSHDYCGAFMVRNSDGNATGAHELPVFCTVREGAQCPPEEYMHYMDSRR